jgi:hypothetical protein
VRRELDSPRADDSAREGRAAQEVDRALRELRHAGGWVAEAGEA